MSRTDLFRIAVTLAIPFVLGTGSIDAALIAYYPMNDGSGSTLHEVSGTAGDSNAALSNSPTWINSGPFGGGLQFNGINQYGIAPTFAAPTTSESVSVWVNVAALDSSYATIVKNWGNSLKGDFHFGLDALGGKVGNFVNDNATGQQGPAESASALNTNTWYQVGFVANSAAQSFQVYVDGVATGNVVSYSGTLNAQLASLGIGVKTGDTGAAPDAGSPSYWHGSMEDLGVFNNALTAGDMKAIYNLGLPSAVSTFHLDGVYPLGEANQLINAFEGAHSTTVGSNTWDYVTGLGSIKGSAGAGDLFTSGGQTFLLLDSTANTGMLLVPEPSSVVLILLGLVGVLASAKRKRIHNC